MELSEWLYQQHFPLQDCLDQLDLVVCLLLGLANTQKPHSAKQGMFKGTNQSCHFACLMKGTNQSCHFACLMKGTNQSCHFACLMKGTNQSCHFA